MKVKLATEGAMVRRPRDDASPGKLLEFGKVEEVPDTAYWRRRVRAGEVVMADDVIIPEAPKTQDIFREDGRDSVPEVATTKRTKNVKE